MADDHHHPADGDHHPHVVPMSLLIGVIITLFVLTGITVAASWVDLGSMNVPVALLIATVKGGLVAAFFMHLRWDKPFNSIILLLSIGFLILFLGIATMDTSEYQPTINQNYSVERMEAAREKEIQDRITAAKKDLADKKITQAEYDARVKELQKPILDALYPHHGKEGEHAGGHAVDPRAEKLHKEMGAIFQALPKAPLASPADNPATPEKVALGKSLYFETRLSKSGQISCNTCHQLDKYGVDGEPTSPGHGGARGDRNSPTVYNAGLFTTQFWDGRAANLEEQAKGPILNPVEMAMTDEASVVAVLKGVPGYVEAFKTAFPGEADPLTYDNLAKAIAAFERTLVVTSPWDEFLAGKLDALSSEQLDGLEAFKQVGCIQCHKGVLLGDGFEKLGKLVPYPDLKDLGREAATKSAADRHMFKVPTLRNVDKTGPYFHDGSIKTLEEAIKLMAKHQTGNEVDDATVAKIKAFLGSLTGPLDPAAIKAPEPVK